MAIDYNRQYVGARYVPKFFENPNGSWDWAAGFQYEPLTMVQYGNNTYTSKKLVPSTIGTPNLNPEYWAQTGDFNGAISNLQEQINIINAKKPSKSYILIGDSYASYNNTEGWKQYLTPMLNTTGIPYIISNGGGEGFSNGWSTRLSNIPNLDYYTDVYFIGGYNDNGVLESVTGVTNGLNACYQICKQHQITPHIIRVGSNLVSYPRNASASVKIANIAKPIGYDCYESGYCWLHDPECFISDNIHPSSVGSKIIANNIFALLNGGEVNVREKGYLPQDPNFNSVVYYHGNMMEVLLQNRTIQVTSLTPGLVIDIPCPQFILGDGKGLIIEAKSTNNQKGYWFIGSIDRSDADNPLLKLLYTGEEATVSALQILNQRLTLDMRNF